LKQSKNLTEFYAWQLYILLRIKKSIKWVEKFYDLLEPEGILLLSVFSKDDPEKDENVHYFEERELRELMAFHIHMMNIQLLQEKRIYRGV
jgi:hypothetical protein